MRLSSDDCNVISMALQEKARGDAVAEQTAKEAGDRRMAAQFAKQVKRAEELADHFADLCADGGNYTVK